MSAIPHQAAGPGRCTSCRAPLGPGYLGRRLGCEDCQQEADHHLAQLSGPAGLYAELGSVLRPTGSGGPRVSGSREPSLGVRLDVLDLMSTASGIPATLHAWLADWYEGMHLPAPTPRGATVEARLDSVCWHLRAHLDWAACSHGAWAEFHAELSTAVASCRSALGDRAERRPPVGRCDRLAADARPCGGPVRYEAAARRTVCGTCGAESAPDWRQIRRAVATAAA